MQTINWLGELNAFVKTCGVYITFQHSIGLNTSVEKSLTLYTMEHPTLKASGGVWLQVKPI